MNTTGKLVFALVLITGLAATGAAIEMNGHSQTTPTIQLDAVVVTPASAPQTIQLAAIRVMPTQADWQYARAHGVGRPAANMAAAPEAIELAAVQVKPTGADWRYARAYGVNPPVASMASASEPQSLGQLGTEILMQALTAFGPGQFLNTGAALHTLGTLAFGGNGR